VTLFATTASGKHGHAVESIFKLTTNFSISCNDRNGDSHVASPRWRGWGACWEENM